jgi:hypothetical protein
LNGYVKQKTNHIFSLRKTTGKTAMFFEQRVQKQHQVFLRDLSESIDLVWMTPVSGHPMSS